MLKGLQARGLKIDERLLCVIDGTNGLRKAVSERIGNKAMIQSCEWRNRANVMG